MKLFWFALLLGLCLALWVVAVTTQEPYRVPDEQPGHYRQTDGKSCAKTGAHPCACHLVACTYDDAGNITGWAEASTCHWFCSKDRCTCHLCPTKSDCPETSR